MQGVCRPLRDLLSLCATFPRVSTRGYFIACLRHLTDTLVLGPRFHASAVCGAAYPQPSPDLSTADFTDDTNGTYEGNQRVRQ